MPAQNNVTTGVKITVDAGDIQNKFTKSVDELNASLSKNQRALGLVYNEQGVLTNALGQTVEGLSQSAIKLGQYVDELGRVRTFQDGFIDGLTKTQIELGQYADELGNVYDKYGQLIGQTEKARRAQESEASAASKAAEANAAASKKIRDSLSHTAEGIAKVAGQFAIFQQLLQQTGASSTEFGAEIAKASNAIAIASGSFKASMDLLNGLGEAATQVPRLLSGVGSAATAAAPAVATLGAEATAAGAAFSALGGPITLALSAVAALSAGFVAFKSASAETQSLSASFEELQKRAEAAGVSIQSVADALKVGAFSGPESDLEAVSAKVLKARDELMEATEAYKQAQETAQEASAAVGRYVAGPSRAAFDLDKLDANWKNAVAEYNDVVAKYVDAARASQKTEEDKLREQRDAYAALLKVAEKLGEEENANTFRKQIETLDGKILEARAKQAAEAEREANAEREATLASSGVAAYLKKAEESTRSASESLDAYQAALNDWNALVESGALSSEELTKAQDALASEYRDALAKRLGISVASSAEQTVDAFAELSDALKAGAINQDQYDRALKELEANARDAASKRLGVTFEKPEPLPDARPYEEKVAELSKLLEEGTINQEQYNEAARQLRDAARAALPGFDKLAKVPDLDATFAEAKKRAEDALEAGIVDEKEKNALVQEATEALATARLDAAKKQTEELEREARRAEEAFAAGIISAKERDKRLNAATDKLAKVQEEAANQAEQAYRDAKKNARNDFAEGLIDAAERDRRLAEATDALIQARTLAAKETDESRKATRQALGVDALMESLKSPVQKYRETLDQIAKAIDANAISAREADALRQRAADAYLKTLEADAETFGEEPNDSRAESGKTNELARSYSSGSEELYLAQVRNATNSFQTTIQETTAKIEATTAATLQATNLSAYYLRELVDASGSVEVWN